MDLMTKQSGFIKGSQRGKSGVSEMVLPVYFRFEKNRSPARGISGDR
jgi:hypothetical protein